MVNDEKSDPRSRPSGQSEPGDLAAQTPEIRAVSRGEAIGAAGARAADLGLLRDPRHKPDYFQIAKTGAEQYRDQVVTHKESK